MIAHVYRKWEAIQNGKPFRLVVSFEIFDSSSILMQSRYRWRVYREDMSVGVSRVAAEVIFYYLFKRWEICDV